MPNVTIYQHYDPKSPKYFRDVSYIINRIRDGKSKDLVSKIRATRDGDLKKKLPSILFSGEFSYRNDKSLIKHSGLICLDFDKFPDTETLQTWKGTLESDEYTYCVFLSPSGNGLKCIVKIPAEPSKHKGYFAALTDYYDCPYFDTQTGNLSRICFESYDPYLTVNENSGTWDKYKEPPVFVMPDLSEEIDENKAAKILLKWWTKRYGIFEGQRNSNLYKLCAALNDYGVSRDNALAICGTFQSTDFKFSEIEQTVKSAYKKTEKFASATFKK